jgi:phosphoribosyl-dephospho-CoA transferase
MEIAGEPVGTRDCSDRGRDAAREKKQNEKENIHDRDPNGEEQGRVWPSFLSTNFLMPLRNKMITLNSKRAPISRLFRVDVARRPICSRRVFGTE